MVTVIIYIVIGIAIWALFAWIVGEIHDYLFLEKSEIERSSKKGKEADDSDDSFYDDHISAKSYIGKEHVWKTSFNLEHKGFKVLNIPFEPQKDEVFYIESQYDCQVNDFIKSNIDYIRSRFAEKGLRFIYLPDLEVSQQMMESTVRYRTPEGIKEDMELPSESPSIKSDYILDYLVYPENKPEINPGFAWYGREWVFVPNKIVWYQFDYITFNINEITENIDAVFNDILEEIGQTALFLEGWYSIQKHKFENPADENFDEETQKLLEEVKQKLDSIRLKGISEAIIAEYINPRPQLSHLRISKDFRLFLDDYNGMEIKMEPLNKAVFILFLRHEDGISFKELSDHQIELEIIYRAIKNKNNNIANKLTDKTFTPSISENVKKLTNPLDNSINEKCTRVKEAFLSQFHDSIAQNYYIVRIDTNKKGVKLPRNLIIWEE